MKLKLFTIGLLATLALTSTTIEAMQWQKKQAQAVQELPQVKQDLQAAQGAIALHAAHPDLDTVTHADNATAIDDLHAKLGAATVPSGASANHRITDLHETLDVHPVGGLAADHANKRTEDIAARLGTKAAAPTGPSVHEKLTDALALAGPSRPAATNRGRGAGQIDTLIGREEALLVRLKAGIAGLHANGLQHEVRTLAETKSAARTAVAQPPVAQDLAAAAAATNIHDCLAALGW
jgi:hypothetical protein